MPGSPRHATYLGQRGRQLRLLRLYVGLLIPQQLRSLGGLVALLRELRQRLLVSLQLAARLPDGGKGA